MHPQLGVHSPTLHKIQKFRSEILTKIRMEAARRCNSCLLDSGTPGLKEIRKQENQDTSTSGNQDTRTRTGIPAHQDTRKQGYQDARKPGHQDTWTPRYQLLAPWRFLCGPWTPSHGHHSGRTKFKIIGKSQYRNQSRRNVSVATN